MKLKKMAIYKEKLTFQSPFQSVFLWNVMECLECLWNEKKSAEKHSLFGIYPL